MRKFGTVMTVVLAACFITSHAYAGTCTKDDLVKGINYAVGLIQAKGKAALPELRAYRYCGKDGYFFVVDMNGNNVMHAIPQLERKPMGMLQGAKGEFFGAEMISKAKKDGQGWISYTWENPSTKKIEYKCTYIKTVTMDGVKVFVGSGIYGVSQAECK